MKLYEDRPFAVVGVNAYDEEPAYRDGLKKHKVSWISAYQGSGPAILSDLYMVEGYPTMYLIDHEGVIRAVDSKDKKTIERLVKAAEEAAK